MHVVMAVKEENKKRNADKALLRSGGEKLCVLGV